MNEKKKWMWEILSFLIDRMMNYKKHPLLACLFVWGMLLVLPSSMHAQGSKQVRNRKVKVVRTQIKEVKKGGTQTSYQLNRYDRKGNLVLFQEWDGDSVLVRSEEMVYSKKGWLLEKKIKGKGEELLNWNVWEYNTWGQVIKEFEMHPDGKVKSTTLTFYDKNGDKTREEEHAENGTLVRTITYEYDDRGMISRKIITNKDGEVVFDKIIQYTY